MAAAEGVQNSLCPLFDRQNQQQANNDLQNLRPPDGLYRKMQLLFVVIVSHQQSQQGTQEGVGILYRGFHVMGVNIFREWPQLHISQKRQAQCHTDSKDYGNILAVIAIDHRLHDHDQSQCHTGGHQHITGIVNTNVHPGQRHQYRNSDAQALHDRTLRSVCNGTKCSNSGLAVSAGEAVTGGRFPGLLQNGKLRIPDPRPGYPAGDLQKLVGQGSEEAHRKHIIALPLIHAPKQDQRGHQKSDLVTQVCDGQHEFIQHRHTDAFEKIEKFHSAPPCLSIAVLYQKLQKCKYPPGCLAFFCEWFIIELQKLGNEVTPCFLRNNVASTAATNWAK